MSGKAPPGVLRLDFSDDSPGGFGAYHDMYAPGSTVSRLEGPFHAAVTGFRFPGMPLVTRHLAGVAHERDAARVRLDGFGHVNVQVLRRGLLPGPAGPGRSGRCTRARSWCSTRPCRSGRSSSGPAT